jgi:CHAD domain-containing protein
MSTAPQPHGEAAAPGRAPPPDPEREPLGSLTAPIAARRFDAGADLRASVLAAFRDALADAAAAARRPVADEAVHELRKALRRARAIVRLVGPALGRDDRRDLARTLVAARRSLSAARDRAVIPSALAEAALGDEDRAVARAALGDAGPPPDDVRRMIDEAAAQAAPLGDALAAALPRAIGWRDLEAGLAATYRQARRGLRRARRSRRAFHVFRKRTKELTCQLDLLADGLEGRTAARRRRLAALGDPLRQAVDLVMLQRLLAGPRPADGGATAALLARLDDAITAQIRTARRAARGRFARRPRRFARKAIRGVRRDHRAAARRAEPVVIPVAR